MIKIAITKICCFLLSILRNSEKSNFSREEIRHFRYSFSQFGEDVIISRFLRDLDPSQGIYIDCGAFDPIVISNTLLLHKRGYCGINIDIDPEKIEKFNLLRPNDYNISAALYSKETTLKFLKYAGRATNKIVDINSSEVQSIIGELPISSSTIQTTTLTQVIESSSFQGKEIHYLNIDCEGHDLVILEGLDLKRYTPKVISIEAHGEHAQLAVTHFLEAYGYKVSGMTDGNLIFTHESLRW